MFVMEDFIVHPVFVIFPFWIKILVDFSMEVMIVTILQIMIISDMMLSASAKRQWMLCLFAIFRHFRVFFFWSISFELIEVYIERERASISEFQSSITNNKVKQCDDARLWMMVLMVMIMMVMMSSMMIIKLNPSFLMYTKLMWQLKRLKSISHVSYVALAHSLESSLHHLRYWQKPTLVEFEWTAPIGIGEPGYMLNSKAASLLLLPTMMTNIVITMHIPTMT